MFFKSIKKQKGMTFMHMSMMLVVSGIAGTAFLLEEQRQEKKNDFQTLGNFISEHSRAVAEWTTDQGGAAVPGTYVGTDWLKSNTACGITTGGSEEYLPCGFNFQSVMYGSDPTTVIANVGGVTTAVTTWPAITTGGIAEALGVGIAVDQAEANSRNTMEGVVLYTEDNTGVINSSVNVNNGTGIYVKRSGDTMSGDLGMGANNINNVGVLAATTGNFSTVSASGDITATGNLAGATVSGQQFNDSDDPTTFLNPSGTSRVASIESSTFVDRDDSSYVLDMNGTSTINDLNMQRGTVNGLLQLGTVVVEDTACSDLGTLARLANGKAVSCTDNKWEAINSSTPSVLFCEGATLPYYRFSHIHKYLLVNYNNANLANLSSTRAFPQTALGGLVSHKEEVYFEPQPCQLGQVPQGIESSHTTTYECLADGTYELKDRVFTHRTWTEWSDCGGGA